jgi:serine protease Do
MYRVLKEIPYDSKTEKGLFDGCSNATTFSLCFYNCSNMVGTIPPGLFKGCSKVTNFSSVFESCRKLTGGLPVGMFDGNTGITVLSVPVDEIDNDTMNLISVAVLGNSLAITQGTLALAVGSPLGTNYSILTGNITSSAYSISTIDANYDIFTTDIVGSKNGSGALINLNGEVIGIVTQGYSSEGDQNTLTAISISELKPVIEMLSNNKDIPYIGLEITTVTNTIAKENDIPKGVYIKEVKMDSPAMAAGLQSGDVITEIDGEAVISVDGYQTKLLSLTPGDVANVTIQRQGNDGYTEIKCPVTVSVLQ